MTAAGDWVRFVIINLWSPMRYLILLVTCLVTPSAAYSSDFFRLKEGNFISIAGWEIRVRAQIIRRDQEINGPWMDPASYDGGYDLPFYEIEARKGSHFLRFYFNPMSGDATRTPYRSKASKTTNGSHSVAEDFDLLYAKTNGEKTSFKWTHGSWGTPRKQWITMTIDKSGYIRALAHHLEIAKWSLSSGWHSGPWKETFDTFDCQDLLYSQESNLLELEGESGTVRTP